MNELFDDELRRRLKAYTEEPDPRLWETVSSQIATGRPVQKRRFWMLWVTLGLFVTGGLYVLINTGVATSTPVSTYDKMQNTLPDNAVPTEEVIIPPRDETNPKVNNTPRAPQRDKSQVSSEPAITPAIPAQRDAPLVVSSDDPLAIDVTPSPGNNEIAPGNHATNERIPAVDVITELKKPDTGDKRQSTDPDATKDEKKRRPFNMYFTIMPTMAYNRIEPNAYDNMIVESIDRLATFSTERLGVRGELGAEYPVSPRFKVFGGLVYFQRDQTIGYTEKQVSNPETTPGPGGEIIIKPEFRYVHKSFDHEVRNLGIQLGVNYQVRKRKFLHTAGTGIEFHTALNRSHPPATESTTNPSAYVFYNLYYRMQYPAETKLRAVVQPTLNYSFYINENLNAPFYVKPYGLGLNVGFTYDFVAR